MKNWLILGGILLALFFFFSDFKSPFSQDSQGENTPTPQSQSYKGYECTGDCSGHKAGYAWAEKKVSPIPTIAEEIPSPLSKDAEVMQANKTL